MCSLMQHSERDARIQQARRSEPIYAELADKYLLPYEPPEPEPEPSIFEEIRDMAHGYIRKYAHTKAPTEGPFSYPEKENA